jgi:hypothetical protein
MVLQSKENKEVELTGYVRMVREPWNAEPKTASLR